MSNLLRFKDHCISLEDIYDNDDALCDFCAVASGNGGSVIAAIIDVLMEYENG